MKKIATAGYDGNLISRGDNGVYATWSTGLVAIVLTVTYGDLSTEFKRVWAESPKWQPENSRFMNHSWRV